MYITFNKLPAIVEYRNSVEKDMTIQEIAGERGMDTRSVYNALRRFNLLSDYKKKHPNELKGISKYK